LDFKYIYLGLLGQLTDPPTQHTMNLSTIMVGYYRGGTN